MNDLAVTSLAGLLAGVINSLTGFGSAIILMLFMPGMLGITAGASVTSSICIGLNAVTAWQYKGSIVKRISLICSFFYLLVSLTIINFVGDMDLRALSAGFGGFLLLLSLYFLFFSSKLVLRATLPTLIICGLLSGIGGGLFSIGGPLLAVVCLNATSSREEYVGTIQSVFLMTGIPNFILRIAKGLYTPNMIPLTLLGFAFALIGKALGKKLSEKMDGATLKKLIYLYIGFAGAVNIIKNI